MKIIFSKHALFEITRRQIDNALVIKLIENPTQIIQTRKGRVIFQTKYVDAILNKEMLLRVIGLKSTDTFYIITVYKTSRIDKYWM